jgi:hypothetical protein
MVAVLVFAMLVGWTLRFMMSDEQRQQMPFGTTGLIIHDVPRGRERLGKVERQMDRHQRIDGERQQAEPRGPHPLSPTPR